MRRKVIAAVMLTSCLAFSVTAHDLFLKFDSYFLRPQSRATVRLLNGTFQSSDGAVRRERMRDVTLVAPSGGRPTPARD